MKSTIMMSLVLFMGAGVGCAGPMDEEEPQENNTAQAMNNSSMSANNEMSARSNNTSASENNSSTGNETSTTAATSGMNNMTSTNNDTNTSMMTNTMTANPNDPVKLTDFYDSIVVEEGCSAGYCHGFGGPEMARDFFLKDEEREPLCGATRIVVPGKPEESILWIRVRPITEEDRECGVAKMPKGSETGLDEEKAEIIYQWILDGAQF